MYFGIGGKSDPNAQKDKHIMHNPGRDEPVKRAPEKKDHHQDVMAFERKLQYDNLVHAGVSPVRAAQQVGRKVPPGSMLTPQDIKTIIETGTVKKSKIG